MRFVKNGMVEICYSQNETEAVQIAVTNLKSDLTKVLNSRVFLHELEDERAKAVYGVQNGPCCIAEAAVYPAPYNIQKIVVATRENFDKCGIANSHAAALLPEKKEAFVILVKDNVLYLCGNDRRGTIFAIYDFCESIGVSPWYFFADVPVKRKESFSLEEGYQKIEAPSVEYRGIFINDEEELEKWVQMYMAEKTIGSKTYAYIFELLLRLKLNYIWPAMHVNSFNANVENGALAEKMGIIVGTSHCDMLMRSNNREWEPWKKSKGYEDVIYDFSIEGENRDKLIEYWRESVEQNQDFEVTYTLGMRGIHDSGFNTKALEGLTGEELLQGKIDLLTKVFAAQNKILEEVPHKEALRLFVPYKEVLELYDNGLEVPEDYTLIWTNDNYGYVRRYPDKKAQERKGGNGIYYHQSYWAPPEGSYLFVNTIPAAQTRNELLKAYENGITKLWVTNFGAIKPLEQQLSYYAALAWNVGKENDPTQNVVEFLANWIDKTFTGNHGQKLAEELVKFDQVVNMRKLELMDNDVFYQSEKRDEAIGRVEFLKNIFNKVNNIYDCLPAAEKDAFFELILMRVHAAYYTNAMYYLADRSLLLTGLGLDKQADECFNRANEFDEARQAMLFYYNHVMADGKWNGIVTPEDFPPPRTAMYPAAASNIAFEKMTGFMPEIRNRKKMTGEPEHVITIQATQANELNNIPFSEAKELCKAPLSQVKNVKVIEYLGRGFGDLVEFESEDASLSFSFEVPIKGEYWMSLERFPSLNSVGKIKVDYQIDSDKSGTILTEANDEHRSTWKQNILDNVDFLSVELGTLEKGQHVLTLLNSSKYFAISRLHISDKQIRCNQYTGIDEANAGESSWNEVDLNQIIHQFYADVTPEKRPEYVQPAGHTDNCLIDEDIYCYGEPFSADCTQVLVADALRQTKEAYTFGEVPEYCIGVGRNRAGLYYAKQEALSEPSGAVYNLSLKPGTYIVWACLYTKGNAEFCFELEMDGQKMMGNSTASKKLWSYPAENIYRWIPIKTVQLEGQQHEVKFTFYKNRMRLEGICLQPID